MIYCAKLLQAVTWQPHCRAPAGQNQLKKLDNVMYLRQFRNLRLVNLAGNPICKEHDYRRWVGCTAPYSTLALERLVYPFI